MSDSSAMSRPAVPDLAQSNRQKALRFISFMLIGIGVMAAGAYAYGYASAESTVQKVIDEAKQQGRAVDQADIERVRVHAIAQQHTIAGMFIAMGVAYVACGLLVFRWPVQSTVLALALYLVVLTITGLIEPRELMAYAPVKVIIIFGLWRAIRAARIIARSAPATA